MRAVQESGLSRIEKTLREIAKAGNDLRPVFDEIGRALTRQTIQRFVDEVDPSGISWIPSERALREGNQTLTDTGRLRESITYLADSESATVLTSVGYGTYHQFGVPPNKKRAFLGINDENEVEILDIAIRHLIEASRR